MSEYPYGTSGLCTALPDSRYYYVDGAYFDHDHILQGRDTAFNIIVNIEQLIQQGGGTFIVQRRAGTTGPLLEYQATYWVSGNVLSTDIHGVALAIFKDFELGWELWQGGVLYGRYSGSAFAMEDFPSNYIGFVDAVRQDLDWESALRLLGCVRPSISSPPQDGCLGPVCDRFDLKNWDFEGFTPKKEVNGEWVNVPWPQELQMTSLNDPGLWRFEGDHVCLLAVCKPLDSRTSWKMGGMLD